MNSRNCLILGNLTQLYYWDRLSSSYKLYSGDKVRYDVESGNFYINTTETYELNLFIGVRTKWSPVYYLPLYIVVTAEPQYQFNLPPYFAEPSGYTVNYTVN